jgi:heme-degrading monooxygenase HmoA
MSVLMTLRIKADGQKLKDFAARERGIMHRIVDHAKSHGCQHHQFYAGDGEILVVDEWESAGGFQAFFDSNKDVPRLMQESGAEGEPEIAFWEPLEIGDEF